LHTFFIARLSAQQPGALQGAPAWANQLQQNIVQQVNQNIVQRFNQLEVNVAKVIYFLFA
jgi:hypothetical protein